MKKGPIIFILILLLTLVFILGVQYGKKVNVADEALSLLMSITPNPPAQDPIEKHYAFEMYTNDTCGVSFVYPNSLHLKIASSGASLLSANDTSEITVSCSKELDQSTKMKEKSATQSIELREFSVQGEKIQNDKGEYIQFSHKHPNRNLYITVTASKSILPLIEKTFEFMK
ncbi:hypothetical protein CO051_02560 [Candidatus Roizmanbacteria bacterium CG_4_9_14_0_2_um_filter_39_13]|uniref:Uncharacterized protein n=2 Tax=Candidatus Roizmaniibacteriota TaxID=1752723 RepID=A0A2M8F0K2_9BACT|nr:MAG: hypothetical protein COY15_03525 [Candidatus Roizmanbacteria bacterium CG_4_10_14_0_2_um_filter_39_12]PJC32780.1 MAG: hypothetical protein CO051_02560 [Candidatus Roizmanbacteria bacterium CG_4_9_14_0_2_um_filter_39_13]PJE61312.1 MAG: hypothetical protein COU87_05305 [Candidatus Roizmanbacteria bacterium CG10_big_fil_rev_8_21_14_0_10_39_12]